jgi:hypothetical protein
MQDYHNHGAFPPLSFSVKTASGFIGITLAKEAVSNEMAVLCQENQSSHLI